MPLHGQSEVRASATNNRSAVQNYCN